MHDLEKEFAYCKNLLRDIDIAFDEDATIEINTRAKRRWGQCRHRSWGNSINISSILADERVPVESLRKVILHELLHTVNGCQNHGYLWQRFAGMVNHAYGYAISRTDSEDSLSIPNELRISNTMEYKYILVCENCGQEIKRMKASRLTKYPHLYRCGKCGGVLTDKKMLNFKKEVEQAMRNVANAEELHDVARVKFREEESGQFALSL